MNQRRLLVRALPIGIAILVVCFQYFSSEKITNEAGRTARHALNPQQEETLGLQSYQQVLQEAQTIDSGPEYELVKRVAQRLAGATGPAAKTFDWRVSLVSSPQVNAFCLPGGNFPPSCRSISRQSLQRLIFLRQSTGRRNKSHMTTNLEIIFRLKAPPAVSVSGCES